MTLRAEHIGNGVTQLAMSTWRGRLVGYTVSAYVLRGVLIDSGFARVERELLAAMGELVPRGAVITHRHEDHSGNAAALATLRMPLLMHPECDAALRSVPPIRLYRSLVWGTATRLASTTESFDPAPLEIIETPGHTSDHVVVWDAERSIVASGDLFLGVKVRVAHEHERPRQLVSSLKRVLALEPKTLLDAHRGPLDNASALLRAKIDWMEETIGEIETLAGKGAGEREIQRLLLGREDFVGYVSRGEYSKLGLVRAVLREEDRKTG